MPRRSSASLSMPRLAKREMPRPDVPYELNEQEGAIWNAIVKAMPADYFNEAQQHMLASLCTAIVEKRRAKAELDHERAKTRAQKRIVSNLKRDWSRFAQLEQQLMRNMRLTHQSVYYPETAATRQKTARREASEVESLFEGNDDEMSEV
jgi:hypothetical protein